MILRFERKQTVEVQLLREPTINERQILLGNNNDVTMFDIQDGLINWHSEEIVDEDHSVGHTKIKKAELI